MAIFAQAIHDLFGALTGYTPAQKLHHRHEAMVFLTASSGMWYAQRKHYGEVAGIDPDTLRLSIIAILEGHRDPSLPNDKGNNADGLAEARALWASQRNRPAPPAVRKAKPLPTLKTRPVARPVAVPSAPLPPPGSLVIPDDPFYPSRAGHICASRRWHDGETSRYLGPLPSLNTKAGQALWAITKVARSGYSALRVLADDPHALVDTLRDALPNCEIDWTSNGERFSEYQQNAGLRVYLKQLANAA